MHPSIRNHINHRIDSASTFVTNNLPVALSPEQIYEGLISDERMLRAFKEATQYLPHNSCHKRVGTTYGRLPVSLYLRLPTSTYTSYLIPNDLPDINPQGNLGRALATAVQVAMDWHMLDIVWKRIVMEVDDVKIVCFLMPWVRGLLDDFTTMGNSRKEILVINRELKLIQAGGIPDRFPRMTKQLNDVCKSGTRLFAQYRMLYASHNGAGEQALVSVSGVTSPEWLALHLVDVCDEWNREWDNE